MAAGDERQITLHVNDWQYLGASDSVWTACRTGSGDEGVWTATSVADDPSSAAGRRGVAWRNGAKIQSGENGPVVHFYARGRGIVTIVEGA